jgi:class I fructose-bisphosphate aldolase
MSNPVEAILSNYASETPGVLANLRRLMNSGSLAGTGRFVILPVDQGFEHGPARSFASNPEGYDPAYHPSLALEAGCNAYAAPLGFIEQIAPEYAGRLPLILKLNNSDSLGGPEQPVSALTGSVKDALRLGCSAIGFTIYPGSGNRNTMYQEVRDLIAEAREAGLPTIIWSYARGGNEQSEAKKSYEKLPLTNLSDRIRHVVQASFNGKRIVIFSGGPTKGTEEVLAELREIKKGGGFGTIMGRNAFQRPRTDAVALLKNAIEIFRG